MFYLFYNFIFNVLSVGRSLKINCFIIIIVQLVYGYCFINDDDMMLFDEYIYIRFGYADFTIVLDDTPSGVWY